MHWALGVWRDELDDGAKFDRLAQPLRFALLTPVPQELFPLFLRNKRVHDVSPTPERGGQAPPAVAGEELNRGRSFTYTLVG